MKSFIRAMIVPFFLILFPAVWYINRNLMTEQLPPYTEPTTELIALSIGMAVLGSTLFAIIFALFMRVNNEGTEHELAYRRRLFQPDSTAIGVYICFMFVPFVWIIFDISGIEYPLLEYVLYFLLAPIGLPLLVLAPLAIHFHWAVILGLILCVLWMSLLVNIASDMIHDRSLPMISP